MRAIRARTNYVYGFSHYVLTIHVLCKFTWTILFTLIAWWFTCVFCVTAYGCMCMHVCVCACECLWTLHTHTDCTCNLGFTWNGVDCSGMHTQWYIHEILIAILKWTRDDTKIIMISLYNRENAVLKSQVTSVGLAHAHPIMYNRVTTHVRTLCIRTWTYCNEWSHVMFNMCCNLFL